MRQGAAQGGRGLSQTTEAISKPTLAVARAPRSTLQDYVYRQLCELILNGEIAPGQLITIQSLADAFGVSAMPVREALAAADRGARADRHFEPLDRHSAADRERLADLRRVRLEVESLAAIWATPNIGDDESRRLQDCVRAMERGGRDRRQQAIFALEPRVSFHDLSRRRDPTRCSPSSRRYGCRSAPTSICCAPRATISRPTSSMSSCFGAARARRSGGQFRRAQRHRGGLSRACSAAGI